MTISRQHRSRGDRRWRAASAVVAIAAIGSAALTGCSPASPHAPASSSAGASATPSDRPQPTTSPTLLPSGTAEDNLAFFQSVLQRVWDGDDRSHARSYVDALAGAGFDKSAMQVTPDSTPNGNPADAVEVSVSMAGSCLIGQANFAGDAVTSLVMPVVPGGGCLVGDTLPITW